MALACALAVSAAFFTFFASCFAALASACASSLALFAALAFAAAFALAFGVDFALAFALALAAAFSLFAASRLRCFSSACFTSSVCCFGEMLSVSFTTFGFLRSFQLTWRSYHWCLDPRAARKVYARAQPPDLSALAQADHAQL